MASELKTEIKEAVVEKKKAVYVAKRKRAGGGGGGRGKKETKVEKATTLAELVVRLEEKKIEHKIMLIDCVWVARFYPEGFAIPTVEQLDAECKWIPPDNIRNRANQAIKRTKCALVVRNEDGNVPFYGGYVGSTALHSRAQDVDEKLTPHIWRLLVFSKFVDPFNHVICTKYEGATSYMPSHSDKTANLVPNSYICILSFGPTRRLRFTDAKTGEHAETYDMTHGSAFFLGPLANARYKHEIIEEEGEVGTRISVILRWADTHITPTKLKALQRTDEKTQQRLASKPARPSVKKSKKAKTFTSAAPISSVSTSVSASSSSSTTVVYPSS